MCTRVVQQVIRKIHKKSTHIKIISLFLNIVSSVSNTLFPSLFQCLYAFQEEILFLFFNPLTDGHNDSFIVIKPIYQVEGNTFRSIL